MGKAKRIIIMALVFITIAVSGTFLYVYYNYYKYSYIKSKGTENNIVESPKKDYTYKNKDIYEKEIDTEKDKEESIKIIENEQDDEAVDYTEIEGITNVLLIGTDARNLDEVSRSDTIMILSLDDNHKKIKITSIMRDTYAEIPKHGEQKINHSFAYGGSELLMKTIEKNFKIKVDKYAIVNFYGFKDIVDAIDGLEINLKPEEVKELNRCAIGLESEKKNYFGEKPHLVKEPGLQHLDGQQVLNYARMRKIGKGSYDRTERQRAVIGLIANKLKDTSPIKYPSLITKLMACVRTNIEFKQAIDLAYTAYKIDNFNLEQLQMPATKLSHGRIYKNKGWVLLTDREQNTKVLHDFIFEDIEYDASKYKHFSYANSQYYYVEPKKEKKDLNKDQVKKEEPNKDDKAIVVDGEKEKIEEEINEDITEEITDQIVKEIEDEIIVDEESNQSEDDENLNSEDGNTDETKNNDDTEGQQIVDTKSNQEKSNNEVTEDNEGEIDKENKTDGTEENNEENKIDDERDSSNVLDNNDNSDNPENNDKSDIPQKNDILQ